MRRLGGCLALIFLLFALQSIAQATPAVGDLAFKTTITTVSQSGYGITAKINYLNFSYYSAPDQAEIKRDLFNIDPNRNTSTEYRSTGSFPLKNASLFFTLDGRGVSMDGSSPACSPVQSDVDGRVECQFQYYQDASGAYKPMDGPTHTSCGTLVITYNGGFVGPDEYRPSSAVTTVCPKKNSAISAFGTALLASIKDSQNIGVCFPAIMLCGLLLASMYYSGRNPLSLFDLTTPRLPKTKPSRVSGGQTTMAIRTATTRYMQAKRMGQKSVERLAAKIAHAKGMNSKEAKKEVRALFKELDKKLVNAKSLDENTLKDVRQDLNNIFSKYGLRSGEKKNQYFNKMYSKYNELANYLFEFYAFSDNAMKQMAGARAPGKGKIKKWFDDKQSRTTKALDIFESKLMAMPGYSKIKAIPIVSTPLYVLGLPHKLVDTMAQRRSAKSYVRSVQRRALGHIPFFLFTKKVKGGAGEREDNPLGKAARGFFDNGPGKLIAKYHDWKFGEFFDRHNIIMRQAAYYNDPAARYARQLAEAMNTSGFMLHELLEIELTMENVIGAVKARYRQRKETGHPRTEEAHELYKELESQLRAARMGERDLLEVCQAIKKYGSKDQKKLMPEYEERLKKFGGDYRELKQMEQEIMNTYGLFTKKNGLYSDLTFDYLREIATIAEHDVLEDARIAHAKIGSSEEYLKGMSEQVAKKMENALPSSLRSRASELYEMVKSKDKEKGETRFNYEVRKPFLDKIIAELGKEIDVTGGRKQGDDDYIGKIQREGILSQYVDKVAALGKRLNPNSPVMGEDPAGRTVFLQLMAIAKIANDDKLNELYKKCKVENINDFETLFQKGTSNKRVAEILSKAIANLRDNPAALHELASALTINKIALDPLTQKLIRLLGNRNLENELNLLRSGSGFEAFCRRLGIDSTKATNEDIKARLQALENRNKASEEPILAQLTAILDNRAKIIAGLERLGAPEFASLCRQLGIDPRRATSDDVAELLSKIGSDTGRASAMASKISRMLGVTPEEMGKSSIVEYTFIKVLEKSQVNMEKWGGKIISLGKRMQGDYASEEHCRSEFSKYAAAPQAIEYAALRKKHNFNQYEGEMAQHMETLLYMVRRYNIAAEFAITKGISEHSKSAGALSNNSGSLLGSYKSVFENTVYSFAAQRATYLNLVNEKSKIYHEEFAKKNGSEFDANAYLNLQSRGLLFRDIKKGVAYRLSGDQSGAIPLMEFDERHALNGDIILQKDAKTKKGSVENELDYGPLLGRMKVSDFGSEVFGVVAVRNQGDDQHEHWRKINPMKTKDLSTLLQASTAEPSKRGIYANALAGLDADGNRSDKDKPILRFLNGNDYVGNHLGKAAQFYHKRVDDTGRFAYMMFYDDTKSLREWYAAQARARHALYDLGRVSGSWMTSGSERLAARNIFNANEFFDKLGPEFGSDSQKIQDLKKRLEDEKIGERNALKVLQDLVEKMPDTSAEWKRKNYAKVNAEAAGLQSIAYGAKQSIKGLEEMRAKGMLTDRQFADMARDFKAIMNHADAAFKQSVKDHKEFNRAVIELTGSGQAGNPYYGSGRNIVGMSGLKKEFEFDQGFQVQFFMSVESTAMRDADYNRGGRKGAESFETMNMNTGQGIYENPRWWAASVYEQQMTFPLSFAHVVHRAFLPLAAGFYRSQIGLSSFLQRTELEIEWGKPKTHPLWLLGLGKGTNDILGASIQELSDFSGLSDAMAALRKGGRYQLHSDGTVSFEQSGTSRWLQKWAVESSHVGSTSQWSFQNRLQDRLRNSKEFTDNSTVLRNNGEIVYYNKDDNGAGFLVGKQRDDSPDKDSYVPFMLKDAVALWPGLYDEYRFASGAEKTRLEGRLREVESYIDPYVTKLTDDRPESNQTSKGAGGYFNKDGSRDRFMEIFQRDHANTWRQIIPGMTESDPEGSYTILSPSAVNYYEHATTGRMKLLKNLYATSYDEESDRFVLSNRFDTHRDSFREVLRLETPAMMQLLKFQGYEMQYEMFKPVLQGLRSGMPFVGHNVDDMWTHRHEWSRLKGDELKFVNARLNDYGADMGTVGETISRKYQNWHYLSDEKSEVLHTKMLARIYDRYIERERLLALASSAKQSTTNAMRRQRLLQNSERDMVQW